MRADADDGLTPRERQIQREQARLDKCLPDGGHEYVRGQETCIHCGEPFPVIARDYGDALMPGLVGEKVWLPTGAAALSAMDYHNVIQLSDDDRPPRSVDIANADLVVIGGKVIKDRHGEAGGKLFTLDSFFTAKWDCDRQGHIFVNGSDACTECGTKAPPLDLSDFQGFI